MDLGSLEHWPSNTIPRFNDKLLKALPGVGEHSCSLGKQGGFRERLEDGRGSGTWPNTWPWSSSANPARTSRAGRRGAREPPGRYNVIYGYAEEQVGVTAGRLAVRLLDHLIKAEPGFDFEVELERLIMLAERRQFGPSTQAILDEAVSRDIPFIRLNEQSLVQLGQGKYQQRIRATMTSMTSALAVDIAADKKMTNQLLPRPVSRCRAPTWSVPTTMRWPSQEDWVPRGDEAVDGDHGRGVGLDLRTERAVRTGFRRAQKESRRGHVIVESFVAGNDYRGSWWAGGWWPSRNGCRRT